MRFIDVTFGNRRTTTSTSLDYEITLLSIAGSLLGLTSKSASVTDIKFKRSIIFCAIALPKNNLFLTIE
ncbi:MAG: hypothetical protein RLZZ381_2324 [Cyanobacteriota bacterium]|jgi:hypothetical protein